MSKDTFYFSHDYNARNDSKIKKLLSKQGYLGYGLFWAIVEDLYNNTNVLRLDYDSIAFDLRTTPEIIKSIINDFDLFVFEGETFGSLSVQKRLDERNEKSKKARTSVMERWANKGKDTNVLQTYYDSNTIKERKGKENKGKEIDIPAEIDFLNYCKELMKDKYQSYEFSLKSKYNGWVADGWQDGNKKAIKNWKTKIANTIPYLKAINIGNAETRPKVFN